MAFNPLEEKGIPIDKQLRNWSELNVQPYNKDAVHPYTQCRVITMNGVEVESILFSHQFARHTDNIDLKRTLALSRRIEQQQQKAVNWLIPGDESTLEVTIGYEQVAVDLTAFLARTEPDPYIKQALEYALLEDFDHLYRYANLMELTEGKKAEKYTQKFTDVIPGRPTIVEHRHPFDDVRAHYDKGSVDPLTRLHVLTIVAAEQQTMNFYMTIGNRPMEPIARGLYLEIGEIEEQHVTHYESLIDPLESWFQQLVFHEYNECYLYYSFMNQEVDNRIKQLWELHLHMEIEQLRIACELMKKYEGIEPAEILPKALPEATRFESNVDFIRDVLLQQVDWRANGTEFVKPDGGIPDPLSEQYRQIVNAGGVPSEEVIEQHTKRFGSDYRSPAKDPAPKTPYKAA